MKQVLAKYKFELVLFFLSVFIVWPIFLPGYFSHHDDLQVMRIFEMRRCLLDLQIPCRWVPDMGYGNGFPLFNYYGVFPYYIGALFSFLFGFIGAAKTLFFIPLFFAGLSMYYLAKELFGEKGGFVSAVLYIFAPYRAVDSYVRGAVAESFALFLAPLVFYFGLKLIKERNFFKYFLGFVLSFFAFLTTHNIMTMFFTPVVVLWLIFWLTAERKLSKVFLVSFAFALSFGLSSFFLLPAYFEKSLVRTETLIRADLDFRAHFVSLEQIFFDRSFGYGASVPGIADEISFQIGWPHWFLVIPAIICNLYLIFKKKFKSSILILSLLGIFGGSLFMMHNKSSFIWEALPTLQFAQFPWRFLSVTIFSVSILGGVVIGMLKTKLQLVLIILITVLTLIFNFGYFAPKEYYFDLKDSDKLSGELWEVQQKAGLLDYIPKQSIEPREKAPEGPIVREGKVDLEYFDQKSAQFEFRAKVYTSSKIEMPIFDFPDWQVFANNEKLAHNHQNYLGRISFNLDPGEYLIKGKLNNTPIRNAANWISLMSILTLGGFVIYGKVIKKNR